MMLDRRYYRCYVAFLCGLIASLSGVSGQQLARSADRLNCIAAAKIRSQPTEKWKFQTQGQVYASPVVFKDKVIVGSCDSNLYALDKISGKIIWKYKTGGEIRSSVAIDSGLLYFVCADGLLYALSTETGQKRWTFATNGERKKDTWDYFHSSPTVGDGIVYFGSGDGHIYAVNGRTGELSWKFPTGGVVHASPTLAKDGVMIGSFDGYFYCLEKSGTLRWKFKTVGERYFPKGEIQFHAVTADSSVYFGARDFNLYALNIKDGTGYWIYHQPGSWTSVPSLSGEKLIVTMSDSYSILALDKIQGTKLAEPAVPLNTFSSATVAGSNAFFGTLDGIVYKFDIVKGSTIPVFQTESSKRNRHLFVDEKGKLRVDLQQKYADDINRLFADYLQMGSIFSTIWIEQGTLYFGAADGAIYAIE
ncbi:PQQ-binding-like beta-propeller repeat protein [Sphingobacterium sp. HMA12]|uniref:beta-alanine-activating enzyme beta-propeller domain-containing protein n=1 Tax=Sphingobacterium sp. HMA12 TaxID=2050894 RepID=UPI000CE9C023|nr:PQQ-binding-like beta-propeller repeat protein [Sphingobacterium sp. HMA12]